MTFDIKLVCWYTVTVSLKFDSKGQRSKFAVIRRKMLLLFKIQ